MSLFGRFRNLFKSGAQTDARCLLPSIVQANVNPRESWNIIDDLGDGAFGKVQKVVNKLDPNVFAAEKCIEVQEGEELEDFIVEIDILTACKHQNIVGLYACYYFEKRLHMMLELCSGGAVDDIMLELEKGLSEPQIAYIAKYTCEALAFLHSNNVIHRDLKAGNILLTHDAVVKLADFGVSAKLKDKNSKRDTFIGTPYWMAPEVMLCETFKDQPYDVRADIWSFGVTLIEMAQMEPPHSEVSPMRVLIKVQKSDPPTLSNPGVWSVLFNDFLKQCLVKNPANRLSADALKTHPFLISGTDKRSVLMLLAEVKAEVNEEEIIDEDRGSVDESIPESEDTEDQTNSTWNESELCASSKKREAPPPPIPITPAAHSMSLQVVSPLGVNEMKTPKKSINGYAASQRSDSPISSRSRVAESHSPRTSQKESNGYSQNALLLSPRQEAMSVLGELDCALEQEKSTSFRDNTPSPRLQNPPIVRETRPHETYIVHSPEPTRIIKAVVQNARHSIPTSPTQLSPRSIRQANSVESINSRSSEDVHTYKKMAKNEQTQGTQHTFSNVIKVRMDLTENESARRASAIDEIKQRFESVPEENDSSQTLTDIPEGLVKNKIREVIREQQSQGSAEGANRIKMERREADAQLFQAQEAVSKRASTFEHSLPEPSSLAPIKKRSSLSSGKHSADSSPSISVASRSSERHPAVFDPQPSTASTSEKDFDDDYFVDHRREDSAEKMPPPEPPVDYDKERRAALAEFKENQKPDVNVQKEKDVNFKRPSPPVKRRNESAASNVVSSVGNGQIGRKNPNRQTVTKKTRTYMVEGVEVTSTTFHVMGKQQNYQLKRQEMQEHKRLQREEARQLADLERQAASLNEQQERKQLQEKITLQRQFEADLENLTRKQKREIEEAERMQDEELKSASKRLKYEQEKDLAAFRERLRQEMKILKQEIDMLPKAQRKDMLRIRKGQTEAQHQMKEQEFSHQLLASANGVLARMQQKHKEKIASLERQFTLQRHMLLRNKENSEWELEERVMSERYILHRKLFKDKFFMLRSQMLSRQQKEMAQLQKIHQMETDELLRALQADRKRVPKMLRSEAKTRTMMFKESLRISLQGESPAEFAERMRQFEDTEKIRIQNALKEQDAKITRRMTALKERHQMEIQELDEAQNDNRKLLLEREHATMAEHERKYTAARDQWHRELAPKKMELEATFAEELEQQEVFYGVAHSNSSISSTSLMPGHVYP